MFGASWSRIYVFRSTDEGRSWDSALRAPVTGDVGEWQALDARHWLFVATSVSSRQTLWSTQNGGGSWTKHPLQLPPDLLLVGVQMTGDRDGWATAQTHAESKVSASGAELLTGVASCSLHTVDAGSLNASCAVPRYAEQRFPKCNQAWSSRVEWSVTLL
jgi:hypothetical protein